jgi:hypothetical protein
VELTDDVCGVDFSKKDIAGVIFQYPDTYGCINDFSQAVKNAQ